MRNVWLARGLALWTNTCHADWRSLTVGMASQRRLSSSTDSRNFSAVTCGDLQSFGLPRLLAQFLDVLWRCPAPVPEPRPTFVESDAGDSTQRIAQQLEQRDHAAWLAEHVHVVQECAQLFTVLQMCRHILRCPIDSN